MTFAPKMHLENSTREIKSKTGASFERATHRLLAYLQPTELRGNLPNKVQIIPINKK